MKYRVVQDSFGEEKIPASAYWGIQTQRSLRNFSIGEERQPVEIIHALAAIKKAAAIVNKRHKSISDPICIAICEAAEAIMSGKMDQHFPLSVWQTGSGTQTNMNVNEVLSNYGAYLYREKHQKEIVIHPNDHCNFGQSSNDTYPTAMHVATIIAVRNNLVPALLTLIETFDQKAQEFQGIVKIGRTHHMDATPIKLSDEFETFREMIQENTRRVQVATDDLLFIPQGGTAVGNGVNTVPGWDAQIVAKISEIIGEDFRVPKNKSQHMASHDALVNFAATLKVFSVSLIKIANDLRFLASGPRCGLGELNLPQNEQGSSIMPGKVNPTQIEALTQVCAQVIGNETTIAFAGSQGTLQLNVYKPVIIHNILQSTRLLSDSINSFCSNCLVGIQPNRENINNHVRRSLMLVTALAPKIGYDNAALIAKRAFENNTSLRDEAITSGLIQPEEFDELIDPSRMTSPK